MEGRRKTLDDGGALVVAVAIKGNSKSKSLVRWTLEQFASHEHVVFKLLHVQSRITSLPTPMGNHIPISDVRQDVAALYRKEIEGKTREMLLLYQKMFVRKEVQSDITVVESDDIADAISEAVKELGINNLVIGASSSNFFIRKLKKSDLSSRILACTPKFCAVYAVSSAGRLLSTRPSSVVTDTLTGDDKSYGQSSIDSEGACSSRQQTGSRRHVPSSPLLFQRRHALSTVNKKLDARKGTGKNTNTNHNRAMSLDKEEPEKQPTGFYKTGSTGAYAISEISSWQTDTQSSGSGQNSSSTGHTDSSSIASQMNTNFELEKLKIELRHVRGMYAMAQTEIVDASRKLRELGQHRLEEATKLEDLTIREEEAEKLAVKEKQKHEAAEQEAEHVKECVEREVAERQEATTRAEEVASEKERLTNALEGRQLEQHQYLKFTWEEIVEATSSFSEDLKIGSGAYGSVYKCNLHHTTVAVKVLHPDKSSAVTKQFEQELEVLSKIRHPHLLILVGACPERGCLIYEYMQNGSLEQRLLRPNATKPPIPWFERFRIAWELASALHFLHSNSPKPIVHRDLKPANILLDRNLVSKIGDVGLSKMVNVDRSLVSTLFKDTGPVGTFFYIDPEYQRTGVVSPQSDVYAFGVILLQLVTAKPPMALVHMAEKAMKGGKFAEILDPKAGVWPLEETRELVALGLRCVEMRRQDRPDLSREVLPVLERFKGVACNARNAISDTQSGPPSHFICPIRKDVMEDPCVAADGYTYDRKAIQKWFQGNNNSPVTDLPLLNKNILPNYNLVSAIKEWKSNEQ